MGSSYKGLVVDDNAVIRAYLTKLLKKKFSIDICTASNGAECLEVLEKESPDILFLDVSMPVMNGLEVLTILRSNPEYINYPVVMITAFNDRKTVQSLVRLGVTEYLLKPLDQDETVRRVEGILKNIKKKPEASVQTQLSEARFFKKILLIEKESQYRYFLNTCLTEYFLITETSSIAEGLQRFEDAAPDLVITNPEKNLFTTMFTEKKMRELAAGRPFRILYSAGTDQENIFQSLPADSRIERTFDREIIRSRALNKMLGKPEYARFIEQVTKASFRIIAQGMIQKSAETLFSFTPEFSNRQMEFTGNTIFLDSYFSIKEQLEAEIIQFKSVKKTTGLLRLYSSPAAAQKLNTFYAGSLTLTANLQGFRILAVELRENIFESLETLGIHAQYAEFGASEEIILSDMLIVRSIMFDIPMIGEFQAALFMEL